MAVRESRAILEVIKSESAVGARLIVTRPVPQGAPFFWIRRPRFVPRPTYQTVQVARGRHALSLGALTYINHSCLPNVVVDTKRMVCWAVRNIPKGEELSYFYPSTEWVMARPFLCLCEAANCIRIVAGARQLSTDVLSRYFINEHIRILIGDELSAASRSWAARSAVAADIRPGRLRRHARI